MSGLFFPLVLGVWWKRANAQGAVAGMLGGLIAGSAYLIAVRSGYPGFKLSINGGSQLDD